jgi:IS4 transposase
MDLFTLETIEMKLTDYREGEKLSHYAELYAGDIIVGDRAYGSIKSIEYAMEKGADYVLRLKSTAFNLYNEAGTQIDLKLKIEKMKQGAYKELKLHYKKQGKLQPVRLCVYRKTDKESEGSDRQAKKSNSRAMKGKVSETQIFYGKFVVVATSLTETPERILALYRQRWQIELLFKRLKSIFSLDELPAKKDESVKAWFYGKLLLAAICEALDNKGRFSP